MVSNSQWCCFSSVYQWQNHQILEGSHFNIFHFSFFPCGRFIGYALCLSFTTCFNSISFELSSLDKVLLTFQVQEKKVKKIAEMNTDPSKAVGNGSIASSSISLSQKLSNITNGDYKDKSNTSLNKDFSSLGSIQSLRLPVVVVLNLCFICLYISVRLLCLLVKWVN